MERYPAGIGTKGFLQKDVSKGFPEWLERVEVPKKDGVVHHPIVTDTRSLLWIANQNTITPHVWTSRVPRPRLPGPLRLRSRSVARMSRRAARRGARRCAICSRSSGLPSWVKTSGSKGFHIVVPLDGKTPIGHVARFANAVGTLFVSRAPDHLTQEFSKADRERPHLRRHRTQRLQRHVRGGLHRAREARRAGVGAVHVGGDRARRGRARARSRCATCPTASRRSAICGPTCGDAGGR